MNRNARHLIIISPLLIVAFSGLLAERPLAAVGPRVGPKTEKRFPPLQVAKGFKTSLFACDPLVEYPSVIALGPKLGTLFVAHDYMTGLGVKITRRDEVRLLEDTDGDGYADKSTVYAGGFNSIQGMAYSNGVVYVMHSPLLTSLKDTNGDGIADVRRDIIKGLGLPPENNPNRLHCANGVVVGHDGWLYLALGDRGCDVKRPEGDRLLFQQGGILRCRADGRDLHVFAGGLRNIYDIALDEELNVFVRDNENDGGDYMIRVCRSFFGADHGYPYLYRERPKEALKPLADLGRGSSAGGTSYLETAFPERFRRSLFFCEWGRAVVRYGKSRAGSHFAEMKEVDFAVGAQNDPYGFKPTDIVVDYDGSMLISDWGDGQRPRRGRGRIYRIRPINTGKALRRTSKPSKIDQQIARLNSASYYARVAAQQMLKERGTSVLPKLKAAAEARKLSAIGRMHAIWLLAELGGSKAVDELIEIAQNDADPRVRAQAIRALADVTDPVLRHHRLDAGRGDPSVTKKLELATSDEKDARVLLEFMVAMARLRWSGAPNWLAQRWDKLSLDPSIEHAAMQLLRRTANWPRVLSLLDRPSQKRGRKKPDLRTIALRSVADHANEQIVDGLIQRLKNEKSPIRRREYVATLARVHKKPKAWTYWGFRPAPRPANTVAWDRTEKIANTLDQALQDTDFDVRMDALTCMRREAVPVKLTSLKRWQRDEIFADGHAAILAALSSFPAASVRDLVERVVRSKRHSEENRLTALGIFVRGLNRTSEKKLLELADSLNDGPVLAAVIAHMAPRGRLDCNTMLISKTRSKESTVRAAAIAALAERKVKAASQHVGRLLADAETDVRIAAARAAGSLDVRSAAPALRRLATSQNRKLCKVSLEALRHLRDSSAVPQAVVALKHAETQIAALNYLADHGDVQQARALTGLAQTSRSNDVLTTAVRALSLWSQRARESDRRELDLAIAAIHQQSGTLLHWSVSGPHTANRADRLLKSVLNKPASRLPGTSTRLATGVDATVILSRRKTSVGKPAWLAASEVISSQSMDMEFLGSATGRFRVWLNGKLVHRRKDAARFRVNSDRFTVRLVKGVNRVLIRIDQPTGLRQFHLRIRSKRTRVEHERLIKLALSSGGSPLRGRELFFNTEKSQCAKCHRIGDKGGRIGPDLTGIGSRFSKIHLVESLLEPSRTIAPSYATFAVALKSGRIVTGVKTAESVDSISLGDKDGKLHAISRRDIDLIKKQTKSTMPEGLEKRLTDRQFLDLIAFLLSQKKRR